MKSRTHFPATPEEFAEREREANEFREQPAVLSEDGLTYCAPWCGAHCTKAAFDRATMKAGELCDYLGEGWEPRVWENVGWFYEATNGALTVNPTNQHQAIGSPYTAWLNLPLTMQDRYSVQFITRHHDPRRAVELAVEEYDKFIADLQKYRQSLIPELSWRADAKPRN